MAKGKSIRALVERGVWIRAGGALVYDSTCVKELQRLGLDVQRLLACCSDNIQEVNGVEEIAYGDAVDDYIKSEES